MRRILMLVPVCFLSACFGCRDKKSVLEPETKEPKIVYNLVVHVGQGVNGEPREGKYSYETGKSVAYLYEPMPGFKDVVIQIGNSLENSSGTILLDRDKEVFVSADSVIIVPQAATPTENAAKRFLDASTPSAVVSNYSAYLQAVNFLYETRGLLEANRLSALAYRSAYETAGEEAARRAGMALGGRVFNSRGEVSQLATNQANLSTEVTTTVIFVNGLMNSMDGAAQSRAALEAVMKSSPLAATADVLSFYNASAWYDEARNHQCLREALELVSASKYLKCQLASYLGDWGQSARQVAEIFNIFPLEAEKEAETLAKFVQGERSRGRVVILVGHSQGTLMVNQAWRELGAEGECVGMLSLAGPLGSSSWAGASSANFFGGVIAGVKAKDAILHLGINDLPKMSTEFSASADAQVVAMEQSLGPILSFAATFDRILIDVGLHNFTGSYAGAPKSAQVIRDEIARLVTSLKANQRCARPTGARLYAVSGDPNAAWITPPTGLWVVAPYSYGKDTLLATLSTSTGSHPSLTDIARSPTGELWGVSFEKLYKITESPWLLNEVARFRVSTDVNSLAFDAQGRAYIADLDGKIFGFKIESGNTLEYFWEGSLGGSFTSSGDLAVSSDGRIFLTAKDSMRTEVLVRIKVPSGNAERVGNASIGFSNVWGLGFVGQELFGLTADESNVNGSLITIDPSTGAGRELRKLGFNAFGGAGMKLRHR